MTKNSWAISAVLLILLSGINCADKKYSDIEKQKIIQGIIVGKVTGSSGSAISCTSSFTFSGLGLSSKCGSCHSGGNLGGGLDVTSYNSTIARVSSGSPEGSTLYSKINGGSMSSYSDTTTNNAVYCWIKAGAAL